MEDYDWIEIAYVFDDEPTAETYESLLDVLPRYPGNTLEEDEFGVNYSDGNGVDERRVSGSTSEVAELLSTHPNCRISVPMGLDLYDLSIGFNKTGAGLLPSSSRPYVRFATTIYVFEDPDEEDDASLENGRHLRREFVEVLAHAADVLEPRWGFGRRGGLAVGEDDTVESLAAMTTQPLYEYNVFRPETVEAIGRDRVLSAPAWYVEELDWGGIFLAVREPPDQCNPSQTPCVEVADHLGIPLARTERYH